MWLYFLQFSVLEAYPSPLFLFYVLLFSLDRQKMSSAEAEHREEEVPLAGDDTGAQVAPIVRVEEVAVTTGEDNEDPILDMKATERARCWYCQAS